MNHEYQMEWRRIHSDPSIRGCKHLAAFATSIGLYEYNVILFSIRQARKHKASYTTTLSNTLYNNWNKGLRNSYFRTSKAKSIDLDDVVKEQL